MFGLAVVDIFVILLYFTVTIGIGVWAMRRIKNKEDYLLGGRSYVLCGKGICLPFHSICTAFEPSGGGPQGGLPGSILKNLEGQRSNPSRDQPAFTTVLFDNG